MNTRMFDLPKCADYYIWWLLNCSQGVNEHQIRKDVDTLITQLHSLCHKTDNNELIILEKIKMCDYNISLYQSLTDLDDMLEGRFRELEREQFSEMFRQESREQDLKFYRHEYRQLFNQQYDY